MTRHARHATVLALVLSGSLLFGALGDVAGAARSEDGTTPPPASSSTSPTAPGGESVTADDPTPPPPSTPVAAGDSVVVARGRSTTVDVLANDTCGGVTPCPRASLTAMAVVVKPPSGMAVSLNPTTGALNLAIASNAAIGVKSVTYRITDANGSADGAVSIRVVYPPLDSYNPPAGTKFSHPFRKSYRNRIYNQIIRTINSVPYGGQIRIASWSFSSKRYLTALRQAHNRGVSVQIVLAQRNVPGISDWTSLRSTFGTNRSSRSWVFKCSYSCRGGAGTMHSKIFLFSQAAGTRYITMTGSANLTDFAISGQWNQMNTVTNNPTVYNQAVAVFEQMRLDRPAPYVEQRTPSMWMYYYPRGKAAPGYDFAMKALEDVRCTGAVDAGPGGRTQIRIAMYAWYENRGRWLAKRVRALWDQGCDVRIIYGIAGNTVKNTLYSPKGRGRIPMRQILLTNKDEDPIYYIHDKFVAVNGHVGAVRNSTFALQGSFNFSDLGFRSDENFQRLIGRVHYNQYRDDFNLLWRDPQARAPSPTSVIKNVQRTAPAEPALGTGRYAYMEAD
ncbi:phospholipase D-like domain-containing protein [Marmoricola sp. RAF53]|uniref:phospholipase D-like domain-containing protein n=1 Tax=Marmoricola sp. RAF53 TaxID=3233059 RepID=UPI003F9E70F2